MVYCPGSAPFATKKIPIATIIAITKTTKIITGKPPRCGSASVVAGAAEGCVFGLASCFTCQGRGALARSGRVSAVSVAVGVSVCGIVGDAGASGASGLSQAGPTCPPSAGAAGVSGVAVGVGVAAVSTEVGAGFSGTVGDTGASGAGVSGITGVSIFVGAGAGLGVSVTIDGAAITSVFATGADGVPIADISGALGVAIGLELGCIGVDTSVVGAATGGAGVDVSVGGGVGITAGGSIGDGVVSIVATGGAGVAIGSGELGVPIPFTGVAF